MDVHDIPVDTVRFARLELMAAESGRSLYDEVQIIVDNAIRLHEAVGGHAVDNRDKPFGDDD